MLNFIPNSFPGTFILPCINNNFPLFYTFIGESLFIFSREGLELQTTIIYKFHCWAFRNHAIQKSWAAKTTFVPFTSNITDDSWISVIPSVILLQFFHVADGSSSVTVIQIASLKHHKVERLNQIYRYFIRFIRNRKKTKKILCNTNPQLLFFFYHRLSFNKHYSSQP